MDEKALISQLAEMMEMQTQGLIKYIDERFETQEKKFNATIEHKISKRLDSLTDGYKLVHEKQYELERKMEDLESRLAELESKTA